MAKGHQSVKVFSSTAPKKFLKSHKPKKIASPTPFGIFQLCSLSHNSKKIEGGPSGEKIFPKKSLAMPKKMKGGTFGLVRHCMLCGKLFGSVPRANRGNLKFCRTFGRTILVTSGVSKKKY